MIKRVLFFLALIFGVFGVYWYINRESAEDLVATIKEYDGLQDTSGVDKEGVPYDGTSDAASSTSSSGQKTVQETTEKSSQSNSDATSTTTDTVTKAVTTAKDTIIQQTVGQTASSSTHDGQEAATTIILHNPTFTIYQQDASSTSQKVSTNTPVAIKTTTSTSIGSTSAGSCAKGFSVADCEMLKRLANNVAID